MYKPFFVIIVILLIYKTICITMPHWPQTIREAFTERTVKCNDVDGRCYEISTIYNEGSHEEASGKLGHLNNFAIEFIRHLRKKYLFDHSHNAHRRDMVEYLLENFDPETMRENVPVDSTNTSFVTDKGRIFALCLREKVSGKHNFHDMQLLEFVLIHELSHLTCREYGHGTKFWCNFKIMLLEAESCGMHKSINYGKHPEYYCSLYVDYNPVYDNAVRIR